MSSSPYHFSFRMPAAAELDEKLFFAYKSRYTFSLCYDGFYNVALKSILRKRTCQCPPDVFIYEYNIIRNNANRIINSFCPPPHVDKFLFEMFEQGFVLNVFI